MTTFLIVLIALALIGWLTLLVRTVRLDGWGQRAASDLPRSHHPDTFEIGRP